MGSQGSQIDDFRRSHTCKPALSGSGGCRGRFPGFGGLSQIDDCRRIRTYKRFFPALAATGADFEVWADLLRLMILGGAVLTKRLFPCLAAPGVDFEVLADLAPQAATRPRPHTTARRGCARTRKRGATRIPIAHRGGHHRMCCVWVGRRACIVHVSAYAAKIVQIEKYTQPGSNSRPSAC